MFRHFLLACAGFWLPALLVAHQPSDETPPPQPPDVPVVGNVQPLGWGLQGAQGRHYFFGGIAIADYTWQNRHRVVSLAEETQTEQADPKFLYYRELGDGHRWAVAKSADRDRTYAVYFQARGGEAGRTKWTLFQRARLIEDSRFPDDRRASSGGAVRPSGSGNVVPADRPPTLSRPEAVFDAGYAPCCGQ